MEELKQVLDALRQPEYRHVLLNPIPLYGLIFGLVALIGGLVTRSRGAQMTALLLLVVGGGLAWPVFDTGEEAAPQIARRLDGDGRAWLDQHEERAEVGIWFFILTGGLALAALIAHWKWPKPARWLTLLTLVATLASLVVGGWIGHAGGQIRHTEFRTGPPPPAAAEHEH
jgi:hypothetical protein